MVGLGGGSRCAHENPTAEPTPGLIPDYDEMILSH